MKTLVKHYKVFFPGLYSLIVLLIVPIAVAGLSFLTNSMKMGGTGVIVALAVLSVVHLFGDYFVFNGISSKAASLRLMKSSHEGYNLMKKGVIIDQAVRLINIMFCVIIATYTTGKLKPESAMPYSVSVLFGIVLYAVTTAILIGLRYADGGSTYQVLVSFGSMVSISAIIGIFLLYAYEILSLELLYVIGILVMVIALFFGDFAVLRSYKKSFVK